MKKIIILLLVIAAGVFTYYYFSSQESNQNEQKNNQESLLGNQEVQNYNDITVESPEYNEIISSPLSISGKVKGTWLFEATASVILTDWDGRIIAESYIETDDDWMTDSFVPFTGVLEFEKQEDIEFFSDVGTLIFQKANPSGLPVNDDTYEIKVRFR